MKKILMVIGSLRENSFNRQLARTAAEMLNGRAEVKFLDYGDIPYMNQDKEFPVPVEIARVREEVKEADGVWIFTAEYNYQLPGMLKNLLDWLSRPIIPGNMESGTAAMGKPAAISGVGGKNATAGARERLTELLSFIGMKVMEKPQTGIELSMEEFQTDRLDLSVENRLILQRQAEAFLEYIG